MAGEKFYIERYYPGFRDENGVALTNDLAITGDFDLVGAFGITGGITLASTNKLYFRDTGLYVYSNADGKLTISADGTGQDDLTVSCTSTFSDNALISSDKYLSFRDSDLKIWSSADGQLDLSADTEIQIASTTIDVNGNVDISGTCGIGDHVTINAAKELRLRDSDLKIWSSADGQLDISADTEVQIASTTIDINGNVDISGTCGIGSHVTVASASELRLRDSDLKIWSSADGQLDLSADTEIQIASTTIDINGAVEISGNLSLSSNLIIGSTTLAESELAVLDAVSAGTVAASKALVVDASRDLATVGGLAGDGLLSFESELAGGASVSHLIKKINPAGETYSGTEAGLTIKAYDEDNTVVHGSGENSGLAVFFKPQSDSGTGGENVIATFHKYAGALGTVKHGIVIYGDMTNGLAISGGTSDYCINLENQTSSIADFKMSTGNSIGYGAAAPASGTWAAGDIVFNTGAAAGGTCGWICTTAGTPGTWKTFGSISA